jgi:hypothetical protein
MDTLLPRKKVLVDGTIYFIHGLIHGNPWIKINPLFKKSVAQELEKETVLCEDGFVSWIPNSVSMGETEYFSFGKRSTLNKINFLKYFFYDYFLSMGKKDEPEIFHKIRRMNSLEDLIQIRSDLFKNYLEEPCGMNTLMSKKNSGTISNPKGDILLLVRRYIYESKTSLDYAKKNNLDELHIVVGCAHELPLEYLLKNKGILERYSL